LACLSNLGRKQMYRITNRLSGVTLCLFVLVSAASAQTNLTAKAAAPSQPPRVESDRSRDGLVGPVRRVRTEVAKLTSAGGAQQESKHVTLEIVAYDIGGHKIENQYFPIAGATLTGKEVYKYDEKGNISEMTLLNTDGSLLSKEVYKYEYDFAGNWFKMITSVAVVEGGKVTFEPTEVTYRAIMYYLDENMLKSVQPATGTTTTPPVTAANTAPKPVLDSKAPQATNKAGNNKKTNAAPVLPTATANANKVAGTAPLELKTMDSTVGSNVPLVNLDAEPPSPGPKPILKPISGGVLNGTAISLPAPTYPDAAKRMRTAGTVSVDVVLDESGRVVSAVATSGPTILREAAVQAALRARFSPTKLSGQPVKVAGVINYKFALVP
jgi:TonB family protein